MAKERPAGRADVATRIRESGTLVFMRVLLLEDDEELRRSVARVLRSRAVAVDEAGSLAEADEHFRVNDYDVAVLDRMLPDGDATTVLRSWRSDGLVVPTLFLTALDAVPDRVHGLDAGADDYLIKPFAIEELLARVRSLARRTTPTLDPIATLGDLVVDPNQMTATRAGRCLALTPKEFSLLLHLVRNAGRAVSRGELLEHCWDEFADPVSNIIDARVALLRTKLEEPPLVHTVRGVGYLAQIQP